MSINISRSEAAKIYVNYFAQGNSLGTDARTIGEIMNQYPDMAKWLNNLDPDETDYDFVMDEEEYKNFVKDGKKAATEATGYKNSGWDKTKQIAVTANNTAVTLGNAVGHVLAPKIGEKVAEEVAKKAAEEAAKKAAEEAAKKVAEEAVEKSLGKVAEKFVEGSAEKATEKVVEKTAEKTAEEGAKQAGGAAGKISGKGFGILIASAFDAVTAALYWATRPNKKQADAVAEMNEQMPAYQSMTSETHSELTNMDGEIQCNAEEACAVVDETNGITEEKVTEYLAYKTALESYQSAITSGFHLSDDDKAKMQECVEYMTEHAEEIPALEEAAFGRVNDVYEANTGYESGFDDAAQKTALVDGATEYVANFDKSTMVQTYIETGLQGANGALAGFNAYKAISMGTATAGCFGAGAIYLAAGAVSAASAVSDAMAAGEQIKFAKNIKTEIGNREATEGMNEATKNKYEESVENYAVQQEVISNLTIEQPDSIEAPEDVEIPEEDTNGTDMAFGIVNDENEDENNNNTSNKKKKNEINNNKKA